ncbi:hypothetical protein F383_27608 [Gossypium arboreum]|uniref:Uncharacterized protein n=1 Tax=Gossypium arboreum TaxID=29729 RepID=A0A0B0MX34_GOSAR|nr:hypothetical protein F383_27608 [Gossypium arboreum]
MSIIKIIHINNSTNDSRLTENVFAASY